MFIGTIIFYIRQIIAVLFETLRGVDKRLIIKVLGALLNFI